MAENYLQTTPKIHLSEHDVYKCMANNLNNFKSTHYYRHTTTSLARQSTTTGNTGSAYVHDVSPKRSGWTDLGQGPKEGLYLVPEKV